MSLVVLDTTVLIDILRGRPATEKVRSLNRSRDVMVTTAINVEEVVRGLRPTETKAAETLFTALRVMPVGRKEAELAGRWRRDHAARGITLHQADCLIAAVAANLGARLATGNPKDFPMGTVSVERWPVGCQPKSTADGCPCPVGGETCRGTRLDDRRRKPRRVGSFRSSRSGGPLPWRVG